jgi:hypothetical protein
MAQNMPFANRIVILVNIYGELFAHKITLTHTHKKFKYFGKNFDFNPKPLGMLTGCAVLNSNKPIKRKIAWYRKHALTIYNNLQSLWILKISRASSAIAISPPYSLEILTIRSTN